MQSDICPKCGHQLTVPAENCPRCGVIFAKLQRNEHRTPRIDDVEDSRSTELFLGASEGEAGSLLVLKLAFWLFLVLFGLRLIFTPILEFPSTSVFLHSVNLVFHEAGHVLFMPLGRFMQVLGGTLMQLIVPAAVAVSFVWRLERYGAMVGFWWLGESLLDISPYINDARAGQLMLLGGVTGSEVEDYHDWEILLTRLGMMHYDHVLAKAAFSLGSLIMLCAMLWGAIQLYKGWHLRSMT